MKISIEDENSPELTEEKNRDEGAEDSGTEEDLGLDFKEREKIDLTKKDLPRKKKTDVGKLKERIGSLTEELNKREVELIAAEEKALRAVADSENYKKRMGREVDATKKYAAQPMVEAILPALDNLDKAIAAAEETEAGGQLVAGVEMVVKQLKDALSSHGLERLDVVGKLFDPETSEALQAVEKDDVDDGIVLEEFIPGYRFKDRIIQHAKVVVVKNPDQDDSPEDSHIDEGQEL